MRRLLVLALIALASFAVTVLAFASLSNWQFHRDLKPAAQSPLPKIGPAPQFTLTSQAGMPVESLGFPRQGGRRHLHLHPAPIPAPC